MQKKQLKNREHEFKNHRKTSFVNLIYHTILKLENKQEKA